MRLNRQNKSKLSKKQFSRRLKKQLSLRKKPKRRLSRNLSQLRLKRNRQLPLQWLLILRLRRLKSLWCQRFRLSKPSRPSKPMNRFLFVPNPNRSSRLKKRAVITAKIGIITKAMLQRIIIVLVVITAIIRKIVIIGINVADLISRPIGMDVIKIVMPGIIVRASVLMASIRSRALTRSAQSPAIERRSFIRRPTQPPNRTVAGQIKNVVAKPLMSRILVRSA